jgi:hypothetical protein
VNNKNTKLLNACRLKVLEMFTLVSCEQNRKYCIPQLPGTLNAGSVLPYVVKLKLGLADYNSFYVSVNPNSVNFRNSETIFIKLGMNVMAPSSSISGISQVSVYLLVGDSVKTLPLKD